MGAPDGPRKRSVVLSGHRTSLSIEDVLWKLLQERAAAEGVSVNALVARIDAQRALQGPEGNLSSAVRVYLVEHLLHERDALRAQLTATAGESVEGPAGDH